MQPKIITKEALTLAGFSFFGDPFHLKSGWHTENEIGRLWSRLETFLGLHHEVMTKALHPGVGYEVHIQHSESQASGEFEIFVGFETAPSERLPVEMLIKTLPASRYAVLTLQGEQMNTDIDRQVQEWLSGKHYQMAGNYNFQYYDERFKGMERLDESAIDFYFPIC